MIKRENYIQKIRGFYDSDLIKIITGIRRCGKSIILKQIKEEISQKKENIISLDFEDSAILKKYGTEETLLNYIEQTRQQGLCYIFLDEVQRVKNWAEACRTLRIKDCSVFISGSNSKLLSREFTKELSGRYVSFRIRPFVYKEAVEYCRQLNKELSLTDYLVWGGFPKRFEMNEENSRKYLNEINETIILNDLINRYKIRKTELFKNIASFIFISNSRIISARSIERTLKSQGIECSIATITKFISYLEEAFAVENIKQFSTKAKKELSFYNKLYNADVALNSIHCADNRFDLTHNLENIVYNELLFMGCNLEVFTIGNKEIDFKANLNGKDYMIQVAYSIADEKAYEREFAPFTLLDNTNKKIIITNDEIDYSTSTVQHIKLKDFLLMNSLEEIK